MAIKKRITAALCTFFAATALAGGDWETRKGSHAGAPVAAAPLDKLKRPRGEEFGYEGAHGPDHWPSMFADCGGKAQSPIDIVMNQVQPIDVPVLEVPYFEWAPSQVKILNNGHTVQLQPADAAAAESLPLLRGGPLTGEYRFLQLHFHWGQSDGAGSEHALDGSYYAMEMHMVFSRKTEYGKQKSYRVHGDAAVLAIFLELAGEDNADLEPVVSQLPEVQEVNAEVLLQRTVSTAGLFPSQRGSLLVYNGSLTTPPCSETVTWLIQHLPITVSSKQVAAFRQLQSPHGQLKMNRRPVQALNDRAVYLAVTHHGGRQTAAGPSLLGPVLPLYALVLSSVYCS